MQFTYSKSQRLIAYILLLSISLQSCKNSPIPMPPLEQEAIESTSTSSKHGTLPQNQFTKKRGNVAIIRQSTPLAQLPKLSSKPTDALTHDSSSDSSKGNLKADLLDKLPIQSIDPPLDILNNTHTSASNTTVTSGYSSQHPATKWLQLDNTKITSNPALPFSQNTQTYREQHTLQANQLTQSLQRNQATTTEEKLKKYCINRPSSPSNKTSTEEQSSKSLPKEPITQTCINKTPYFTVAGGYKVKFICQGRHCLALIKEDCFIGFTRKMYLPVYQNLTLYSNDLAKFEYMCPRFYIYVCPPEKDKQGNGYVYLGSSGLKGGGKTTLHQAIDLGNIKEAMQIIMDASANATLEIVHDQDDAGNTPLHKAAGRGYTKLVKKLVELGANINVKNNNGRTPLHQAVSENKIKTATQLIELGADINLKDNCDSTTLMIATYQKKERMVALLVDKGADVDVDNDGDTALILAVSTENYKIAQMLLAKGASLSARDKHGNTPLMVAKNIRRNNKIIKCLEEAQLRINQNLISAAKVGGHQEIITCINRGADINTTDKLGRTPLILAVIQRSEEIVHLLINKGADINKPDNEKGYNPLIWAALIDYIDITHILIEKGANLNIRDKDGNTALVIAEKIGNNKIIKCLKAAQHRINQHLISAAKTGNYQEILTCINRGANVNAKDKEGNTALIWTAYKGYIDIARTLIKKGAKLDIINYIFPKSVLQIAVQRQDKAFIKMIIEEGINLREIGEPALFDAVYEDYEDIVLMLIRSGVNIDARNGISDTPLMMALAKGHISIAQILLKNGANVKVKNRFGRTPLMYASQWGHLDIAQILIEKGANINEQDNIEKTALINAVWEGHKELVELLIDEGAAINAQNHLGQTALMNAAIYGHVDIIDFLLNKKKADFTQQDSRGNTALMYAVMCNQLEAVKVLATKKESLTLKDNAGFTALMLAAQEGYKKIVKLLIDDGADINDCNKIGINSLLLAAEGGHLNTINLLIKNGAKLDGNIADPAFLRIVMDKGYTQIVKTLSEAGIDIDATCSDKKPALVVAAEEGHEDIVDIFIEKRADLDKQDKYGRTALMLAIINGNIRIAEKLILAGASTTIKDYENNNAVSLAKERDFQDLLKLINTPRPNYLINTIAYVPCNDRDLESDSSDEEITDEFEEQISKFNPKNIKKLTFKTFKTIDKRKQKQKGEIAGDVHQKDIRQDSLSNIGEVESNVIQPFLEKISEGAFYSPDSQELQRIAVSFALNRPRSLSTRRNKCLSRELNAKVNSTILYKKFATFWDYPWYDRSNNLVKYDTVRSFYKQLKRYDKEHGTNQAEFFREVNEDNVKHHVPYQSLRERLKIHRNTKTLARQYKKNNSIAPIYFSIIDSDVINFNGIYTSYDQIYLDSKLFSTTLPIVMTTGYEFPAKAEELPESFDSKIKEMVPALKVASQLDRVTRIATASIIPLGVYYPEPNLCILLPKNKSTLPEPFEGKDSKEKGKGNLESAILLRQVKNRSGINEDSFIFSDKPPLITTIPDRAARYKNGNYISFSDPFKEGQYHRISIKDIKRLMQISQSHVNKRSWAENLYRHRVINLNGMDFGNFRTRVGKFYASMHPLFSKDIREMKRKIEAILTQERRLQVKDNQELLAEGDKVRVEDAIKETIIATSELLSKFKIINLFDSDNYETAIDQDNTPSGPRSISITELISSTETQISSLRELVHDNHISLSPEKLEEFENLLQGLEDSIEEMKNPPLFSFRINPYDPYPNRQFTPQEDSDSKGVFKAPAPILGKRKRVASKDDEDATKRETAVSQSMDVASVQKPISPYQENRNKQVRFTQPQRLNAEEGNNNSSSAFGKLREQRASVNSVNNKKLPQPSHTSSRKKLRTTSERSEDYEEEETTHNKKSNSSLSNTQNSAVQPFNQPYLVHEEEDHLQRYDYSTLEILTRVDIGKNLPIARKPLCIVENVPNTYQVDGKKFRRHNVSGGGMRCFFNAAGLNVKEQINKLREHKNDPIVRYMIANEIVSAATTPDELPKEVKCAINFDLYLKQREQLSALQEIRSDKLNEQTTDSNQQNTQILPNLLRTTKEQDDTILENLRQRAFSLKAFNAFLDYHIQNEQMMVTLHDVQGDDTNNPHSNYTSIDAIAYINQLGIKIYQPENGELRLRHKFIPANATKIVYLYHEGVHFQALIPG